MQLTARETALLEQHTESSNRIAMLENQLAELQQQNSTLQLENATFAKRISRLESFKVAILSTFDEEEKVFFRMFAF